MDLLYMSDAMAYHAARGALSATAPYGYDDDRLESRSPQQHDAALNRQRQKQQHESKGPCRICEERKRRSLMRYIRAKSHEDRHSESELREEEEGEGEEAEEEGGREEDKEEENGRGKRAEGCRAKDGTKEEAKR